MLPDAAARRAIVFAGCLGMIYTQLTMSPAATEYARTLGATSWHIGLLGALPTLMFVSQFAAAFAANRIRQRRPVWMAVAIVERLLFLPVALLAVWPGHRSTESQLWLFIATTALNHALLQFCAPLWLSWMGDYLPKEGLSRFWGVRHNWMQWAAAAALFGGALWLHRHAGHFGPAFGILLIAGAICGVVDVLMFLRIHEPPVIPVEEPDWREVLAAPFRDCNFRRFIFFQCYWNFATMIGSPFISAYLLMKSGMGADRLLMLWAASWIGGAVLSQRLGRLVETYGNKPVLSLCTMFKTANLLALLLLPANSTFAFWLLVPVFMFDALLNAGMAIAQNGFLLKNSPAGNRTMFVAAGTALAGIVGGITSIGSGAAIAIADGWTISVGSRVWGPYEVAFATSIILRIGGAWLCRYVRESSTSSAVEVLVQLIGVTPIRVLQFPLGLYRSRFGEERPVPPVTMAITSAESAATAPVRERVQAA